MIDAVVNCRPGKCDEVHVIDDKTMR